MDICNMQRDEIQAIWKIDRREIIHNIYYLVEGSLVLHPEYYDMQGWHPGEEELYTPILLDCYDRGGTFYGAFEEGDLVGVVILESKATGSQHDQLQMKFLHVSAGYRKKGLGRLLFEKAVEKASLLGARKMYISATPSENTINFYLGMGCRLAAEVDAELFALEPEDIHLEYPIDRQR